MSPTRKGMGIAVPVRHFSAAPHPKEPDRCRAYPRVPHGPRAIRLCSNAPPLATAWQADEALLDSIRGGEEIARIIAEVAGDAVASANAGESVKVQRQVVRDCLAGTNERAKIEGWCLADGLCISPDCRAMAAAREGRVG
jgi:hypothetical protein